MLYHFFNMKNNKSCIGSLKLNLFIRTQFLLYIIYLVLTFDFCFLYHYYIFSISSNEFCIQISESNLNGIITKKKYFHVIKYYLYKSYFRTFKTFVKTFKVGLLNNYGKTVRLSIPLYLRKRDLPALRL